MRLIYCQPCTLKALSLEYVCQQLYETCLYLKRILKYHSLKEALSLAKQIRLYYINALPVHIHSQIINRIRSLLVANKCTESNISLLLVILLRCDIKILNLLHYDSYVDQAFILKLLASEGTGLTKLYFKYPTELNLDYTLLHSALLNMKNLSYLNITNANDAILEIIGKACSRLKTLDVSHSKKVTDKGLENLIIKVEFKQAKIRRDSSWRRFLKCFIRLKMKDDSITLKSLKKYNCLCYTLTKLNLTCTAVTSKGMIFALTHIYQLKSLMNYNVEKMVRDIYKNVGLLSREVKLNLTKAIGSKTTSNQLSYLARACPKIAKLRLYEPRLPLEELRILPHITSLFLEIEKRWMNSFYNYLETNGHNLRVLRLLQDNTLNVDLKRILSSCPNIIKLSINVSYVIWTEDNNDPPLKYLRKIDLGKEVNALAIIKILSLAPELTALHVDRSSDLTNEHLEDLFKLPTDSRDRRPNNLFQNLMCFYINKMDNISTSTVLSIFHNYKQLKIGNVAKYDWYHDDDNSFLHKPPLSERFCTSFHYIMGNCVY